MPPESDIQVMLSLRNLALDNADLDKLIQGLQGVLPDFNEEEDARPVFKLTLPDGNNAPGAVLVRLPPTEVNATRVKHALDFLSDRLSNNPIATGVEARGHTLSVSACSQQELLPAVQIAQEFLASFQEGNNG